MTFSTHQSIIFLQKLRTEILAYLHLLKHFEQENKHYNQK